MRHNSESSIHNEAFSAGGKKNDSSLQSVATAELLLAIKLVREKDSCRCNMFLSSSKGRERETE